MSVALDLVRILVIAAGLLLPGTGWALAGRWPLPWLAGGMLSALALLGLVILTGLAGLPVTGGVLAGGLLVVAVPGWWRWWRQTGRGPALAKGVAGEWWLALPALPLVAVAIWRAALQPLSGADVSFRWDLLARLLVEHGGLGGYPPVTAADFADYFWADAINPLVSAHYAWAYLAGGSFSPGWTILPALLQTAGLLTLLAALGRHWGGPRGGWFAWPLAAGTMLLQFAFNLGQETGFTALGAAGMVWYLLRWRASGDHRLLVPAALAASLAACAREYGAVAAMVGAAWLLVSGAGWRRAAGFAAGAALLPVLWQARVWWLTGNPVFPQAWGGWPTNPVFDDWMRHYRAIYGDQLRHGAVWLELGRMGLVTALPALAGLAAGWTLWRRQAGAGLVVAVAAAFAVAWLASVPFTAGGLFYSMRVLSPVCLLGCAWGGAALARVVPGRVHLAGVVIGLALLAADGSLRAWTIPQNPYQLPPQAWPTAGYQLKLDFDRENDPFLREVARRVTGRVLSDSAGLRDFFRREGKSYSPLWSPDVAWLFSGGRVPDAAPRLRALGFSHVLVKRSAITFDFLADTGAHASLAGHMRIVMANPTFILLELDGAPVPAR